MKKIIPILILLGTLAAAVYWYLGRQEEQRFELGGSGTIEGTQVEVTPKIAGRIAAIHADQGDRVESGEVLVELAHDELSRQLEMSEAAVSTAEAAAAAAGDQLRLARTGYRLAKTEYDRAKKLHASGSVSQRQLDAARAQRDSASAQAAAAKSQIAAAKAQIVQAKAQVDFVKSQIDNATLPSPIDGVVLTKNLEIGENAFPGSSVLSLVDDHDLWVKVYVSEAMMGRVKLGMEANVWIDTYPDRPFNGRVTYVSPKAEFTPKNVQTQEERVRLVYAVKVAVDGSSGELKIGMPADVELIEG